MPSDKSDEANRLNKENEHHYIVFERMTDWGLPNKHLRAEVDPSTVCQYTGLTDKNGRKIFEGDIVSIPGKKNHNVKFEYGQFCIGLNWPIVYSRRECEVIGNIFDNPELIGE